MFDISRDIHSLTDFKKNTSEFINQLKETGDPVVLAINGHRYLIFRVTRLSRTAAILAECLDDAALNVPVR